MLFCDWITWFSILLFVKCETNIDSELVSHVVVKNFSNLIIAFQFLPWISLSHLILVLYFLRYFYDHDSVDPSKARSGRKLETKNGKTNKLRFCSFLFSEILLAFSVLHFNVVIYYTQWTWTYLGLINALFGHFPQLNFSW